VKGHK